MPYAHTVSFSSAQFSHSVVSDSLWPHESQHTRPPCPSPAPGVYTNSCPSSRWCHPAISSSVVPFSSCPQALPASGFFQWINFSHNIINIHKKTGATGYLWKKYFVLFVLPMPQIISWIFSYKFKVLIKQTSLMKALFPLISLSWVHALFPLCMKWVAKCEAGWDDK